MSDASRKVQLRKPGFFAKVLELQSVMWNVNSGLTSTHPFDSRPSSWPTLTRGISFWTGSGNYADMQIYLLGNPVTWLTGSVAIVVGIGAALLWALVARRTGVAAWELADGWFRAVVGFLYFSSSDHFFLFLRNTVEVHVLVPFLRPGVGAPLVALFLDEAPAVFAPLSPRRLRRHSCLWIPL